jgi:hypothetical protein
MLLLHASISLVYRLRNQVNQNILLVSNLIIVLSVTYGFDSTVFVCTSGLDSCKIIPVIRSQLSKAVSFDDKGQSHHADLNTFNMQNGFFTVLVIN